METEREVHVTKELKIAPSDLTELIVSLGGLKFWFVAIFPLYVGWVLAQPELSRHLFIDDIRVVLAMIALGPFLGTFTFLLNLYYDMANTDRSNPRKKYVKMVEELIGEGLMDRETILLSALAFAALALLLAAYTSGNLVEPVASILGGSGFIMTMILMVLLSVAYSHPRVRWKGVAGMDLLTNMVGFGVLCTLAGWTLQRAIEDAPWWYISTIALFIGALYAPTTASDYEADKEFGIRTLAVWLGVRRTLHLGFLLQLAAGMALFLGWIQRWFPFHSVAYDAMLPLWPFFGLQVVLYAVFMRRPSIGRIWALLLLLSVAEGLGVLLMLWGFVGGRGPAP